MTISRTDHKINTISILATVYIKTKKNHNANLSPSLSFPGLKPKSTLSLHLDSSLTTVSSTVCLLNKLQDSAATQKP